MNSKIGIIGGSGLYSLFETDVKCENLITPFGQPSSKYSIGKIGDNEVVFLPRHGNDHSLLPSEVNYRANIYGMKMLGVTEIISIGAVGSLKEELRPRDLVIVDQFFDRTFQRPQTFFGNGFVAHVSFGDPVCSSLREQIIKTSEKMKIRFHAKGTYVNMEGPQFSTRAESNFYRSFGFDVIGMTNLSEARLAREAEICYASLAFVTDYDCWREEESDVTTDTILKVLHDNADNAKKIISSVIKDITSVKKACSCHDALKCAMISQPSSLSLETKKRLNELLKKYY